jgi:hypothetical protein
VNIARGHHGDWPFPLGRIDESLLNSPLAFLEESLLACFAVFSDSSTHSKASLSWNSEDVFPLTLFQKQRGISRLFSVFYLDKSKITLDLGLVGLPLRPSIQTSA